MMKYTDFPKETTESALRAPEDPPLSFQGMLRSPQRGQWGESVAGVGNGRSGFC